MSLFRVSSNSRKRLTVDEVESSDGSAMPNIAKEFLEYAIHSPPLLGLGMFLLGTYLQKTHHLKAVRLGPDGTDLSNFIGPVQGETWTTKENPGADILIWDNTFSVLQTPQSTPGQQVIGSFIPGWGFFNSPIGKWLFPKGAPEGTGQVVIKVWLSEVLQIAGGALMASPVLEPLIKSGLSLGALTSIA